MQTTFIRFIIIAPLTVFAGFLIAVTYLRITLPDPLFGTPYATVLEDRSGELMGARIAADGQWRFPSGGEVPERLATAMLEFEDRHFYRHPGVNPFAIARAMRQNYRAGRVVSGGSTLTMQVIRMSRGNPPRTIPEKLHEMLLATALEWKYSKDEILDLYATHAPFGGNVVGLEAAAWRYYGRPPDMLTWAEAATLAVLPNSPGLIFPGRNQQQLREKRDRLLRRLLESGHIDPLTLELSLHEPLPGAPRALPADAPHLLDRYIAEGPGRRLQSTIDGHLQRRAAAVVEEHRERLSANHIHNLAAMIVDVRTGEVITYVGNSGFPGNSGPGTGNREPAEKAPNAGMVGRDGNPGMESDHDNSGMVSGQSNPRVAERHGNHVDVITAPRSPGSVLKPFLYFLQLNEGRLLPQTLVADIPTRVAGYAPRNFHPVYDGAVPAGTALARSLNVPAVRNLRDYGVPRFHHQLTQMGMTTLTRPPEHYGLSLILGGAEATLWDLAGMYTSMAMTLQGYDPRDSGTLTFKRADLHYDSHHAPRHLRDPDFPVHPSAIWETFGAMQELTRPDEASNWQVFTSSRRLAWKTGTSFGFRDGWAIGITPEYLVAVWAGNADGGGRPGLTGIGAAAPVMFALFNLLGDTGWFREPSFDMAYARVCRISGHLAGPDCSDEHTVYADIPKPGLESDVCPYHRYIHVDSDGLRVNSDCFPVSEMRAVSHFVLPAVQEWYYRTVNRYESLPAWREGCNPDGTSPAMALIYPDESPVIYIPYEIDGSMGRAVFEAAHRQPGTTIWWHLNNSFLGETNGIHQMSLNPHPGEHTLTLVDVAGETLVHRFRISGREKESP
ncbi:MAG: penicillin-binding protein 1C [Balneolaceae bacterium]|nr:MAG: penicillin-binding protein 1C [Balneolaceae bacterium]